MKALSHLNLGGDIVKNSDRIHHYVLEMASKTTPDKTDCLTANAVASALDMKRNFASHHLNRLVEENRLVKSNTRPVYFFPTECDLKTGIHANPIMSSMVNSQVDTSSNPIINTVTNPIMSTLAAVRVAQEKAPIKQGDPFAELIGHNGSLKYIVEQCKSTVLYPPMGLPILLCGPSGVGKSVLAQKIHAFAVASGELKADAPFVTFNCAEYANNAELLSAALFGYVKGAFTGADSEKSGLLEAANHGILFLDEMHRLSPESQEKLFVFLDQGVFRRLGESSGWRKAQVRMVYATTIQPEAELLETFLRRIPLIVKVPSYEERPLVEKLNLIRHLYFLESKRLNRGIEISGQVIKMLVKTHLQGNIGNVMNAIKLSCASALSEAFRREKSGPISIKIGHLPKSYQLALDQFLFDKDVFDDWQIAPDAIVIETINHADVEPIEEFRLRIYALLDMIEGQKSLSKEQLTQCYGAVNALVDTIIFKNEQTANPVLLAAIEKVVNYCLSDFQKQYGFQHFGNSAHVISRLVHFVHQLSGSVTTSEDTSLLEKVTILLPKESRLVGQMMTLLEKHMDETMPEIVTLILTLYFKSLNRNLSHKQANAVIMAHGYATASSIASVANRLLGQYVYDAFDMPLDVSSAEMSQHLMRYIKQIDHQNGLIILVDMGSLETLYQGIDHNGLGDVAIINNITTQLALDVASRVLDHQPMELIVKEAVARNSHKFHFIKADLPKPNAILVTCSTGIGTAQKIKTLLSSCFQKDTMEIIAYDFDRIRGNGREEAVFKQYDVRLMIGTNNPQVPNLPYVSIEDLMMERDDGIIATALASCAKPEEIELMNREIVKAFTLENILNVLTILNPDKVAEQVDHALNRLEQRLVQKLQNAHRMSLTIHLSCMIERLVMKTPIETGSHIEDFEGKHHSFINHVRDSFSSIEQFYNIFIPLSEVTFIYDNIKNRLEHFEL